MTERPSLPAPLAPPLPVLLAGRAARDPGGVLIECVDDGGYTNAAFHTDALRFADGLRELGIGPGDRVAVMLDATPLAHVCWIGTAWLRAWEVPVNTCSPASGGGDDDDQAGPGGQAGQRPARVTVHDLLAHRDAGVPGPPLPQQGAQAPARVRRDGLLPGGRGPRTAGRPGRCRPAARARRAAPAHWPGAGSPPRTRR